MAFSRLWNLWLVAALLAIAVTGLDLEPPACSVNCTTHGLLAANCSVDRIRDCFCTNTTLLSSVSLCTLSACNLTEQMTAASILQGTLCKGVPQASRSSEIVRVTIAITLFTHVIFIMRCISRYMVSRRIWWDDWCLIAAVVCTIPMTIIPIYNASKGFGKHFWDVPPQNQRIMRQLYYVSQIFYAFVQPITKISILLLYFRIFPNKGFRLATNIALIWMACHTIAFTLEVALQCIPVNSLWDVAVKGKCTNFTPSIYAGAAFSIFEDFVIIVLPVFVLKDLNLTFRKKLALGFVFTLGSFACVTSMVRLKYIVQFSQSQDVTWDDVDLIIWSIVEVYTAILCASLVSIRPLIAKLFPKLFPTTRTTGSQNKPTSSSAIWGSKVGMRLSARLRNNNGTVLVSDDETLDETGEEPARFPAHKENDIELGERALYFGDATHAHFEPKS